MARAILFLLLSMAIAKSAQLPKSPQIAKPPSGTNWGVQFTSPDFVDYDTTTGTVIVTNGIIVKYGGATLSARKAHANEQTGLVDAEGDVYLEREGHIWRSEHMRYNFYTGEVLGTDFRTGQSPYFAEGKVLAGDHKAGVYVGREGSVTTDDYAESAGYKVRAKDIVIVPGEYIEARDAVLYIREVPVFYFPYYYRSLKQNANHITFTPGYRSVFGPYLLTTYQWYWEQQLEGAVHLDGRYKRGVGFGPDFKWTLPRFGEGMFKGYYANDLEPDEDPFTHQPIPQDRYRIWAGHQIDLNTNLTAKGVVRYQSDQFVVRDFFESEYRDNVQPNSFVNLNQRWSNFTVDAVVQPRVNDFFETVERLPDIKLTGLRQQIGVTPFYYESDSSFGYFQRKFSEDDTNAFHLPYAATRVDTFHQITLPHTFFGWLNVTPRVGGRFTHYSEAHLEGGVTDDEDRGIFNTGAEASFKLSRLWREPKSTFFHIDGIRHIIEPSVNYVYVPNPTVRPRELPQFDYSVPTTRLLPIEFPDYNAIDSIDAQNVIRLGLRNKVQTKRGRQGVDNLLNWAVYTDWRLDRTNGQNSFSEIYSDMDIRPFSWFTFSSEIRYDVNDGFLREANHLFTLTPNDVWSWQFGHRYLESLPGGGPDSGNNTFYHSFYYRLSEDWAARISHHFEGRDGVLEEQIYTVYRDFRSWTGAFTLRIRERRGDSTDYTFALTFSLKAFPRYNVGEDVSRPLLLMGY
ncbi:MAG TPA: LPS assembly protein LptD [Candidatus Binatia bacterium]|nr:LPS assembly protein LptD [Candidatus Binatia bacterium]